MPLKTEGYRTVFDEDVGAGVRVHAIGVGGVGRVPDVNVADRHVLAVERVHRPERLRAGAKAHALSFESRVSGFDKGGLTKGA